MGAGTVNQYLLFVLVDLIFFICALIYLASNFIVVWKEKSPEHRYKGENLFFFGQVISKLNTTSKAMTLISVTLVLAICLFIAAPILTGWASGYLDIRSMYDVQISSRYNDVYDEEYLPGDDYEVVTDYLAEHGIETDYDCTFSLYLPKKDDFHNRMKYDFPIAAISLSDYNTIRAMLGYGPVSLSENEFTTQWQTIATEEERNSFLAEHACYVSSSPLLKRSQHVQLPAKYGISLKKGQKNKRALRPSGKTENRGCFHTSPVSFADCSIFSAPSIAPSMTGK